MTPPHNRRRLVALVVHALIASLVIPTVLVTAPRRAEAAVPLAVARQFTGRFDYTGTGATLRTASNSGNSCAVTNGATSANLNGIPAGATVAQALLYWAGSYSTANGVGPDGSVTFQGQTVTATPMTDNYQGTYDWFGAVADVTPLVTGNGTYTLSNLTVWAGEPHCSVSGVLGGWNLLVVYESSSLPVKKLLGYDGFEVKRSTTSTYSITGFTVPQTGTVQGSVAVMAWEGDTDLSGGGEGLSFNGSALSDAANPANNVFNSTIGFTGSTTTWGNDFDQYDVSSLLTRGSTSATLTVGAGTDLILLQSVILEVPTEVSDLAVAKSASVSSASVGDPVTFTVRLTNAGPQTATNVVVNDLLPAGFTFVSASATAGSYSQASGNWSIASLPAGVAILTVNATASAVGTHTNTATLTAVDQSQTVLTDDTSSATVAVSNLRVTKTASTPGPVVGGDPVDYTVTVTNTGSGVVNGVAVTDTLPAGLDYVANSTVVTGGSAVRQAFDDFSSGGYSGGTGWSGAWSELNEVGGGAGPGAGNVTVANETLEIDRDNGGNGAGMAGAQRTVDLSGLSAATVSLDLSSGPGNDSSGGNVDIAVVEFSPNGTTFTTLETLVGGVSGPRTYNVSGAMTSSAAFRVRITQGTTGNNEYFRFDNISIAATAPSPTRDNISGGANPDLAAGTPPNLVTAADGYSLTAGQSMTIAFRTRVKPLDGTFTDVVNTAQATATGQPTPATGSNTLDVEFVPRLQATKSASPSSGPVGTSVGYTVQVSHAAGSDGSPVTGVVVSDPLVTMSFSAGDTDGDGRLDAGETWTYTGTRTVQAGDPDPLINTVTVGGSDLDGDTVPTVTASASFDVLRPPTAGNNSFTTDEDTALTVAAPGVLSNDADPDGDPISVGSYTQPTHGTVAVAADGSLGYVPAANYAGPDSFTYTVCDTTPLCTTATVSITVNPVDDLPVLGLTKTANVASPSVGTPVTYTVSVFHAPASDGSPVASIVVSDPLVGLSFVGGDTDADGLLDTGETWTYTGTRPVQVGDPDPLVNTATVTGTDVDGDPVSASGQASVDIAFAPALSVVKTADVSSAVVGDTVNYTITAGHAAGSDGSPVSGVSLSDPGADTVSGPVGDDGDGLLESGETWTWTATRVVVATSPDPLVNTATVSGTDRDGDPVSAFGQASVDVAFAPVLSVVKTADRASAAVGDTVGYTIRVSHAAASDGSAVSVGSVSDSLTTVSYQSGDTNGNGLLDGTETWTYTGSYTVTAADPDPLVNTATVSGTDRDGDAVSAVGSVSTPVEFAPALSVVKTADVSSAAVGDTVNYTIRVSHAAASDGSPVSITSIGDSLTTISYLGGDANGNGLVDGTETWTYTGSNTVTAADPDPLVNTVSVSGVDRDGDPVGPVSAQASVDIVFAPVLSVVKTADVSSASVGDTVGYTITVSHAAGSDGSAVSVGSVSDSLTTVSYQSGDGNGNGLLDGWETWTYTGSYTVTAIDPDPLVNTATVSGTDRDGDPVSAVGSVSTPLEFAPVLSVVKTADVSSASVGDTVSYTVRASHGSGSDGSAVSITSVSDSLTTVSYQSGDTNGNGLVDGTETWVYAGSYTVTATDPDPLVNTATVSGTDRDGDPVSAFGSVSVDLGYAPVLSVVKTADRATAVVGDIIGYTIKVSHAAGSDGSAVSGVSVSDDLTSVVFQSGDTNGNGLLDGGETWTYTGSYLVGPNDPDVLVNTATVTGTDRDGTALTPVTGTATTNIEFTPTVTMTKVASTGTALVGSTVTYTITVEHAAASDGSPVGSPVVTDPDADTVGYTTGDDNGNGILDAGERWVYTATRVIRASDTDPYVNVASFAGVDGDGDAVSAQASASVSVEFSPSIDLTKTADRSTAAVGETITYTITAVHAAASDGSPLGAINLSDDTADSVSAPAGDVDGDGMLDAGETWTWTATRLVAPGDPATLTNIATLQAVDRDGDAYSTNASADVTTYTAGLTVTKSGPAFADPGDVVTYTFTMTNEGGPGAPDLLVGSVSDDVLGDLTSQASGCATLVAGTPCTFVATYVVPAVDAVTNTITVDATPSGGTVVVQAQDNHTLLTRPDAAISIDDGGAVGVPGGTVAYTVDVSNLGAGTAGGVTVTVDIPPYTTPAVNPGWTCDATTCTTTLGDLVGGASDSVGFSVVVDGSLPQGITSTGITATVTHDRPDADPSNDSDSDTTPLAAAPDLQVGIDDGSSTAVPGTDVTYLVSYANAGDQDASGAALTVTVPAGTTLSGTGWVCSPDASAGSTCVLALGDLAVAAGGSTSFVLSVDPSDTGTLTAMVSIGDDGANGADLDPSDNTASDTDTLTPVADLDVAKTAPATVPAGGTTVYTITVLNTGPSDATGVTVADTLPAGFTYLSDDLGGAFVGGQWAVGSLAVGASATIRITVAVDPALAGDVVNTASAAADQTDPDGASDSAVVTVLAADLSLSKTVSDVKPNEGDTVVYTLTVSNAGPDTAVAVTVADLLPSGVSYVSDDSGGAYSGGTWTVGDLAAGADATLNITATVNPATAGATITNTASASASAPADPDGASASASLTVNRPPSAVDDSAIVDEDGAVVIDVLANDSDPDGTLDITSVTSVSGPGSGAVVVNPDGTVTYTPDPGFAGTDVFTYRVCDDDGACATADVTVTVDAVPDPVDDTAITDEHTPVTVAVLANDDPGDIPASVTAVDTTGTVGDVTIEADGTITYDPAGRFEGLGVGESATDSFVYTVTDADGDTGTATVVVTIVGVNDAPVAVDDAYTTTEDTPLTVPAGTGILANDSDVDGDALVVTAGTFPTAAGGSVVVAGDGSLTYLPPADFTGTDSWVYRASDGLADSNQATVLFTVDPVNDPPVAIDDAASTSEDTPVDIAVLANDSDVDGTLVPGSIAVVTPPTFGTLSIDPTGVVTYTPDPDAHGVDTFTYTVSDDGGAVSNIATVTIGVASVNDAPTAVDDDYSTPADTVLGVPAPGILANDGDVDGDPLTVVTVDASTLAGTLTHGADGSFTYDPAGAFDGLETGQTATETFTYTVSDGNGGTAGATVTILIQGVSQPPVAVDDTASTDEDTPVVIDVIANDSDPEGALVPSSVTVISGPATGSAIANADGTVTYTPAPDFSGTVVFTYRVCDATGACDDASVTVVVAPIPDPPTARDDAYVTDEDVALTVPAPGVLSNDDDPDGDPVIVSGYDPTTAGGGAVSMAPDGSFTYTPAPNFNGPDSFGYTIDDGTGRTDSAVVDIYVNSTNDAPVAVDDAAVTDEDNPVVIDVLGNDTDPDGDVLVVDSFTQPAHGSVTANADGSLTYTPAPNYNGPDGFSYVVCDSGPLCDTALVAITVNPVNDPPVALDDAVTTETGFAVDIPVLANDSDPEADVLTVDSTGVPANGTVVINADGTITYTPDPGFVGGDSFDYQISDGNGGVAQATVTVTVTDNTPPVAADDAATVDEDGSVDIAVLANDVDPEGDVLTVTAVSAAGNGVVTINPDGTVHYVPDPDFNGVDGFTYTVCDDGIPPECVTAAVTVTVNPINDPPYAVDDVLVTDEDVPLTVPAPGVLSNDGDIDGDALVVDSYSQPADGTVAMAADGSLTYTPAPGFHGTDSFTYVIVDTAGAPATATVVVTVNSVNDAPTAVDDAAAVDEDGSVDVAVVGNDTDPDGDPLTVAGFTQPTNGTVALNPDGTLRYTPDPDFNGVDSFTYTVCDPGMPVLCDDAVVTVTVDPVDDPPVAVDDTPVVDEDSSVSFDVLVNDSDIDGDVLTVDSFTQPANGTLVRNPDGSFTYTPRADFNGNDGFEYVVCDPAGACDVGFVQISVLPVNDPPVAAPDSAVTPYATPVVVDVLADDVDPDGDPLTVTSVTTPGGGTVTVEPDGTITYRPALGFTGPDVFDYTVCDPSGACDTATVTVTVGAGATVTGRVWADADLDGVLDAGEADITGVTVTLVAAGPDGVFGTADDVTASSVTTSGGYRFDGVVGGPARVTVDTTTLPGGVVPTFDVDGGNDSTAVVVAVLGGSATGVDFGYAVPNNPPDYAAGFDPNLTTFTGGTLPPVQTSDPDGDSVTVEVIAGSLPAGFTLLPDGTFVGTTEQAGVFTLTLRLCDDGAPSLCVERVLSITVVAVPVTLPGPPIDPPTTTTTPTTSTTPTTTIGPVEVPDTLPFTGFSLTLLSSVAFWLLAAGGWLVRRRREDDGKEPIGHWG